MEHAHAQGSSNMDMDQSLNMNPAAVYATVDKKTKNGPPPPSNEPTGDEYAVVDKTKKKTPAPKPEAKPKPNNKKQGKGKKKDDKKGTTLSFSRFRVGWVGTVGLYFFLTEL
jgi:hypothetical protein